MRVRLPLLPLLLLAFLAVPAGAWGATPSYRPEPAIARTLYQSGPSGRYLLDGTWLSRPDPTAPGAARRLPGDRSLDGWSPVQVPNAYNKGDLSRSGMAGYVSWYRRDFALPSRAAALHWVMRFESVQNRAQVWLNGRPVGSHTGGYLPWEVPLARVARRGVNRLVVRVDNRRELGDMPPGGVYQSGDPWGGWWNFGGILREVYLRRIDRVDFGSVIVRPHLPCPRCTATVEARVALRNVTSAPQRVRLRGTYGTARLDLGTTTLAPGTTRTLTRTLRIPRPRLWSPDHPNLYRVGLRIEAVGGRTLATYFLRSGIRSIVVTRAGQMLLNGRPLHLRGVALHESDPVEGGAIDAPVRRRYIAWVKQIGATLIRSHYPLHPEFQELADREGILVWSEIPMYQVTTRELLKPHTRRLGDQFLRTNIAENQNHPSVLLWSLANELRFQASPAEAAYYRHAAALAHQLDPTRPVAAAVGGYPGIGCQKAYGPIQVIGWNDYFGWYNGSGGSTADRDELSNYLDEFRACYPHKALMVSEFGFEATRDGPVEERGTYEFQRSSAAYHLDVFATKPWLNGAIYWTLQDFLCRPGWAGGNLRPDPPYHHKGLIDLQGKPKPAYFDVQQRYRATRQIGP